MRQKIDCAYCDGQAQLQRKERDLNFRKEVFKVVEHFYKCNICKEEFTTTETDTVTLLQAHNQYREKYFIPFADEIIAIREKYELSAAKMSEVLRLGVNGYGNYEKGEIPVPSIANLISTANNPNEFKKMLEKAKHEFTENTYNKTSKHINSLIEKENTSEPFYVKLNQFTEPSRYTGFKKPNKNKIASVLILFINKCNVEFNDRLKLNKLLFYADFVNYKFTGYSITGLTYRAIDYGPVPTFYDNIYTYFENENIIASQWIKDKNGAAKETFVTETEFDANLFTNEEKLILDSIAETFKNTTSWDLVDLSHKEKSWIDLHDVREIINYQQYAFSLSGVKGC